MKHRNTEEAKVEKRGAMMIFIFILVLMGSICVSFALGRYHVSMAEVVSSLMAAATGNGEALARTGVSIVLNIRLPRIIAAVFVGGALAVSGASYQGIFRNPMVSPDILGASAGASFGAAMGILLSLPGIGVQLMSFAFGLLAVSISYGISRVVGQRENTTLVLVLSGMVISSLFGAFISITKYVADPYSKLPEITFWLMGSLSTVTYDDLKIVILPLIAGVTFLMLIRWRLNVLVFGDEEAAALGINTKLLRLSVIVCATLVTSAVVSISGQIGWVGLVIPHLCRMIVGPNYKYLLPVSLLAGSSYLLLVDNVARNLFMVEIPLGILTAIIGAPFFVYLLLHGKKGWV